MNDSQKETGVKELFVVCTPIGNLSDLSPRALEALRSADIIAVESVTRARKLAARFELKARLVSFRESNSKKMTTSLIEKIAAGKNVALISDGGAPLISDPGRELVERAVEAGITVTPVPGPSAIIAALMASPLAGRFYFAGFLPRSAKKAVEEITAILEKGVAVVAFESPERIKKLLMALHKAFGDDVAVTVARELTKVNESFYYGSAQKTLDELPAEVKGEITIVIKRVSTFDIADISARWPETARALDERGVRTKDIAAALSKVYKVDAKMIYEYLAKRSK